MDPLNDTEEHVRQRKTRHLSDKDDDVQTLESEKPHAAPQRHIMQRCHSAKQSPFSSTSGFKDYSGILNWGLVLLVLAGSRLALENILKYGILISPKQYFVLFMENPFSWPFTFILIYVNLHIAFALMCEKYVVRQVLSETTAHYLSLLNLSALICVPATVVL